ncbi:MAG: adenosylcobinamide-GDP ribazoletransferase [Pseudobutyrivibrio sp.]|nr:adenosylcobinamide-GDP ribazoletransferase [Pseudobutyrivibrio sp.]
MKILKNISVAFSMYSRIPMPKFNWNSQDMKYHLIFFPWIGIVIGLLEYAWRLFYRYFWANPIANVAIALAIPIIITGGFHIDGFMDTCDARASLGDRDKKLDILKDSHVGAFAIIKLALLGLLFAAGLSMIYNEMAFLAFVFSFFLSRCLSGIAVVSFPNAREDGILKTEKDTAEKNTVRTWLIVETIIGLLLMVMLGKYYAIGGIFACLISFLYYKNMANKEFGGITGDLAGWFVCICEMTCALVIGITNMIH